MVYSDLEGLDTLKTLRMALIHDLPEAVLGDLTPTKKTFRSREKENDVMKQMLSLLPEEQREKQMNVWKEYQDGKTREAKAVRQLEKIEMALQAKEYEKAGTAWQKLERFIKSADETIVWPQVRRLLAQTLEEQ
jgi:putative hydrolase of HD superfamily